VARVSAARQLAVPLRAALIRYPALPLVLVAVAIFVWFSAKNGGYDRTTWYPGALIVLALVVIGVLTLPAANVPKLVKVAVAALFAYAAWNYLSIGWAEDKGPAWEGANRALLYALVFTLFATWRPRGRTAATLVIVYVLGVAAIGLVQLLLASTATDPSTFFSEARFAKPAGYMNANVALWFSAFLPAVTLGARRELAPALRGVLVASAVLLCGLTVLGQSRGWLFMAPIALVLFVAIVPQRVRTVLTLGLVLAATGAVTGTLLEVYRAGGERGFDSAVSSAVAALLAAAAVAGVVAALAAFADRRALPSRERDRLAGRVLAVAAIVATIAGLAVFVGVKGSPFTVISNGWHDFKTKPSPVGGASRFTGSLGTNRYDFWRVAVDRFRAEPLVGDGSDNFQRAYLADRHDSGAPPLYPHSVELRALTETGLIGAALLAVGLGAGLWAALGAIRRRRGLGSAAAAAATAAFMYWMVHGSIDWFWEFPALGAPALGLLGLAAGLLPRAAASPERARTAPRARLRRLAMAPAVVLALALLPAASMIGPWIAEIEQETAVSIWKRDPSGAFSALDTAASLNPLSATPKLYAGSIALKLGRRADSERYFREAIARYPSDAYAHLELGAVLAERGRRSQAMATLARAVSLDPRDDLAAAMLRRVRNGKPVGIEAVNRELAARTDKLGR
jgi:tetratricopeptide (TPR) repeat protein